MFIVGDDTKEYGKIPWVTFSLLFLNILVFCVQGALGESFMVGFALVPEEITTGRDLTRPEQAEIKIPNPERRDRYGRPNQPYIKEWITIEHYCGPLPICLTLLTSMFLHGDTFHLVCNMWFLAVFGRSVEYALQPGRFLAYYIICGVAGGIAHVVSDPHSIIPCVGASGAISGVMGSYLAIHPMKKIKLWFGLYWGIIEVPAFIVLGLWFMSQYAAAGAAMDAGINTGTAYMAHIGGFVAGLVMIWGTIMYYQFKSARTPPAEEHRDPVAAREASLDERLAKAFGTPLPQPERDERIFSKK